MHQDHRAFDVTDPDASQALDDAIPIVEELLAEQIKPKPRSADVRAAWLAQIAEIRSRLNGLADRAGISRNELEAIAEAEIRHRARRPIAQAPAFTDPIAPDMGFRELAGQRALLEAENARLVEEDRQLVVQRNRIATRRGVIERDMAKIDRRIQRRGRVLA